MDSCNTEIASIEKDEKARKIAQLKSTLSQWERQYALLYKRTKKYKSDWQRLSVLRRYYTYSPDVQPECEECDCRRAAISDIKKDIVDSVQRCEEAMKKKEDLLEKTLYLERRVYEEEDKRIRLKLNILTREGLNGRSPEQYRKENVFWVKKLLSQDREMKRLKQNEELRRKEFEKQRKIDKLEMNEIEILKERFLSDEFGKRPYIAIRQFNSCDLE